MPLSRPPAHHQLLWRRPPSLGAPVPRADPSQGWDLFWAQFGSQHNCTYINNSGH